MVVPNLTPPKPPKPAKTPPAGLVWAVTGHRPPKLGGYTEEARSKLHKLALMQLTALQPSKVITGMALGWDQAIAYAAHKLKIPYVAAIPFKGHEVMWPRDAQEYYGRLLMGSSEEVLVSSGAYSPHAMQMRNRWMVDNSEALLALYDGSSGGTKNCVDYATSREALIVNCWSDWQCLKPS